MSFTTAELERLLQLDRIDRQSFDPNRERGNELTSRERRLFTALLDARKQLQEIAEVRGAGMKTRELETLVEIDQIQACLIVGELVELRRALAAFGREGLGGEADAHAFALARRIAEEDAEDTNNGPR